VAGDEDKLAGEASGGKGADVGEGAAGAAIGVDAPVPKLPRGKGFTLSMQQLMRIGMTAVVLVAVVALQEPCSKAVGRFVTTFGGTMDAKPTTGQATAPARYSEAPTAVPAVVMGSDGTATTVTAPAPVPAAAGEKNAPPVVYERLSPSMTDSELRAAIERAKRRAAAAAAGSAATPAPLLAPPTSAPSTAPPPSGPGQAPTSKGGH
jgi:hypothetical protein